MINYSEASNRVTSIPQGSVLSIIIYSIFLFLVSHLFIDGSAIRWYKDAWSIRALCTGQMFSVIVKHTWFIDLRTETTIKMWINAFWKAYIVAYPQIGKDLVIDQVMRLQNGFPWS